MTHKDYVLIANVIAGCEPPPDEGEDSPERLKWRDIAEAFADALRGTNPAYDRSRFLRAALGAPLTGRDKARG